MHYDNTDGVEGQNGVHNDFLLFIIYTTETSIYLHLPLGSHSFLVYISASLLHLDVYGYE